MHTLIFATEVAVPAKATSFAACATTDIDIRLRRVGCWMVASRVDMDEQLIGAIRQTEADLMQRESALAKWQRQHPTPNTFHSRAICPMIIPNEEIPFLASVTP